MPKFPENKNYKQPPLPMVEGTSIHKEALEKASPTTWTKATTAVSNALSSGAPKPHTHAKGTEGVKYKEKGSGGFVGVFSGNEDMSTWGGSSGEDVEEDHVYESSRGTENA
jgi:hypothetical protein